MNRLRLCAGPLGFCLLDATVTLIGQPDAYWTGDRLAAREANPLGLWLLHMHPLTFIAGVALSLLLYGLLLVLAPPSAARAIAFVILFAHAVGACTWFVPRGAPGWLLAALLLVFASRVLSYCWQRGEPGRDEAGGAKPRQDVLQRCTGRSKPRRRQRRPPMR